jgi:hypothetical protein
MFCTYLTIYRGKLLPPFYIGYTSIQKIQNGYRGSVKSTKYKHTWNTELQNNSHLFITKIISTHQTRQEALVKEDILHRSLQVIKNPLYINQAYASGCFGIMVQTEAINAKRSATQKGRPLSAEHIEKLAAANRAKATDPEFRARLRIATKKTPEQRKAIGDGLRGKPKSDEHKVNMSKSRIGKPGKPRSQEHKDKMSKMFAGKRMNNNLRICPHCGKQGYSNMNRWHFDNCKTKTSTTPL